MKRAFLAIVLLLIIGAGIFVLSKNIKKGEINHSSTSNQNKEQDTNPQATNTFENKEVLLNVLGPISGSTINSSTVIVKGVTIPNGEVLINDIDTKADSSGRFSADVNLDEGDNSIIVTANDPNGNYAEKEITINYQP